MHKLSKFPITPFKFPTLNISKTPQLNFPWKVFRLFANITYATYANVFFYTFQYTAVSHWDNMHH